MRPLALVTGASSGIGRALAKELAARGHDLALVARDEGRLRELAEECARLHGVESRVIAEDLSGETGAERVIERLGGRPVAVLVNNAGFGVHGDFADTDLERELALVRLQIHAPLRLIKGCLPGLRRVLNVASVYSHAPVPHQSVYAACKAFLYSFSQSLGDELRPRGVTVTALLPGVTRTEFRERAGIRQRRAGAGMTAEEVAAYGCRACLRGDPVAVPGWINRVFVAVIRHVPAPLVAGLMRIISAARGLKGPAESRP